MWMLCWCSCFCSSAQFYGQSWETVWSRVCPTFPSGTDSPITADWWPVHIWPIRGLYRQNWPIGCHKTVILRQVMNNLVLVWWPDSPGPLLLCMTTDTGRCGSQVRSHSLATSVEWEGGSQDHIWVKIVMNFVKCTFKASSFMLHEWWVTNCISLYCLINTNIKYN